MEEGRDWCKIYLEVHQDQEVQDVLVYRDQVLQAGRLMWPSIRIVVLLTFILIRVCLMLKMIMLIIIN